MDRAFVLSVPRLGVCEEVEAPSIGDAARRLRDSGEFDRVMTEVMGGCDFASLMEWTDLWVIDIETGGIQRFVMELGWRPVEVGEGTPVEDTVPPMGFLTERD